MRSIRLEMLATTALLGITIAAAGLVYAADTPAPQPPTPQTGTSPPPKGSKAPKPNKNDSAQQSDSDFYAGYRAAYTLIHTGRDYEAGIAKLRTLGQDNHPDVANLLGYASRKLGRYDDAKYWYEKSLAADPNHALTWSYYGAWQAEQGNLLKARDYLQKVASICGTDCREYTLLKGVIDGTAVY